jgi:hypothetical protein
MRCVRRVIGCDAVDGPVQQAFDHGIAVFDGTQGRIHFRVRVVFVDRLFGKDEMMRSHLTGDMQPALSRRAYMVKRPLCREMGNVQMCAIVIQFAEQCYVTRHNSGLGFHGHTPQAQTKG